MATIYFSSKNETPQQLVATADADGLTYDFAMPAAFSMGLYPGVVTWAIRLVSADGTQVETPSYGKALVQPNPTAAHDRRGYYEKCLADIREGIAARLQGTVMLKYSIAGTTCEMPSLESLQKMEATYKDLASREKGNGATRPIPILLRPNGGGITPFGMNKVWR